MGVRRYGLVKKVSSRSTGGTVAHLRSLLNEYLDDNTKINPHFHRDTYADGNVTLIEEGSTPMAVGVDRILSDSPAIIPFGYVRNHYLEVERAVASQLSIDGLYEWWIDSTRNRKTKFHHFIFSVSDLALDLFQARSLDVDSGLRFAVEDAITRFNSFFYSEDSVGGVYGIHHDRKNLHAHLLMHPLTSEEKYVGVSHNARKSSESGVFRVDYQGFLKQSFNQALYDFSNPDHDKIDREKRSLVFDRTSIATIRKAERGQLSIDGSMPKLHDLYEHREELTSSLGNAESAISILEDEEDEHKNRLIESEKEDTQPLINECVRSSDDCIKTSMEMLKMIDSFQSTTRITTRIRELVLSNGRISVPEDGLITSSEKFQDRFTNLKSDHADIVSTKSSYSDLAKQMAIDNFELSILTRALSNEESIARDEMPDLSGRCDLSAGQINMLSRSRIESEVASKIEDESIRFAFNHIRFNESVHGGMEFSDTELNVRKKKNPELENFKKQAKSYDDTTTLPVSTNPFLHVCDGKNILDSLDFE